MTGCAADNETEADKLAKTAGDPGAPNPKSVSSAPSGPAAQTQEEYFKQKGDPYKGTAYPGAAKK
jgi:hypothetical protein